jgi:hypothetical protein
MVPITSCRPVIGGVILLGGLSCASTIHRVETDERPSALVQLWAEPEDLAARDLFLGPGGRASRPEGKTFTLVEVDSTGASPGYDVIDAEGREWSVKLGVEAQPEIFVSRVLWALGYHQDSMHYVTEWELTGDGAPDGPQPPARFRLDSDRREVVGEWSWRENPFVGSRPFSGLLVVNLLLNNWDWKTNNNKIYAIKNAAGETVDYRFVVRDLGAALGRTAYPVWLQWARLRGGILQGTKNDVAGFERQRFISSVDGARVSFDYRGIHGDLLDSLTASDVVWTCRLLERLSDDQWRDAFRAAGYEPEIANRYLAHIKSKIGEGLALDERGTDAASAARAPRSTLASGLQAP